MSDQNVKSICGAIRLPAAAINMGELYLASERTTWDKNPNRKEADSLEGWIKLIQQSSAVHIYSKSHRNSVRIDEISFSQNLTFKNKTRKTMFSMME